ncbi:hypothetical protein LCGC14_1572820 [marine sediment metagenome]|uniref:Uncharacterized protein n=1 Tax=marine sediment metagenome TaxID=412755 RepID=A0A0F9IJ48_9ZZZZ
MGLLIFEDQIFGNKQKALKEGEKLTIRRQHCGNGAGVGCNSVLALQIATDLNHQSQSEYYVVRDCIWLSGEPHLMYDKKRWFGNFVRCPICGRRGKLPIDKPLNWELIEQPKEVFDAV